LYGLAAHCQGLALRTDVLVVFGIVAELIAGEAALFRDGFGFIGNGDVNGEFLVFASFQLIAIIRLQGCRR